MTLKIAVTGSQGIGISTVMIRMIGLYMSSGTVGGVLAHDARVEGKRIGFEILDTYRDKRSTGVY